MCLTRRMETEEKITKISGAVCVIADKALLWFSSRARKSSLGNDLEKLLPQHWTVQYTRTPLSLCVVNNRTHQAVPVTFLFVFDKADASTWWTCMHAIGFVDVLPSSRRIFMYFMFFSFRTHRCPFLHRTAGDTERRYHLRYYKTCMCVHDTDARGFCVKNGQHCAFAHGVHDQRPPVYDIKELEALQTAESAVEAANGGPNILDKERNLMNEDPKWQDTNYVLANYKTEPCKRPPRLCRQGYACPQYHNSKDKRRSPRKFKYRSTPCPNVKHGEEWGEPDNCEAGDNCQYCHTRTEQQFHPEIYKSTKCNDVQQQGYCPRSVFCAFAHVQCEFELLFAPLRANHNRALSFQLMELEKKCSTSMRRHHYYQTSFRMHCRSLWWRTENWMT